MSSLLVASQNSNQVLSWDLDTGAFTGALIQQGTGNQTLIYPTGIKVGPLDGKIYVASYKRGQILRYLANGDFDQIFAHEVYYPEGIAFDIIGRLHVATRNGVVQFASDGTYNGYFAISDERPIGIAFGPDNSLYAAAPNAVYHWDHSGNPLPSFSPIQNAFDVLVIGNNLYVSARGNSDYDAAINIFRQLPGAGFPGSARQFQPVDPNNPVGGHIQVWNTTTQQLVQIFAGAGPMQLATGLAGTLDSQLFVASQTGFCVNSYEWTYGQFQGVFASGGGLSGPGYMDILTGGSRSPSFDIASRLKSLIDRPVPVTVDFRLDKGLNAGTCSNTEVLNQPTQLRHSQDPSHPCSWYSQTLDLGSGVHAAWRFDRTDSKTWTLVLQTIGSVLVTYRAVRQADRDASFPVKLQFVGANGKHFENWPRTVTVVPG